ncbi:hypothetical protein JD844_001870 [Phrynosoma platyrhinos]|uniref:Carboxylic ester hydrolase n=1 Tax=Phrynosoma platyrhinos TaxID=52577 RepID=A0ABQ7TBA4_PHRPL|nr:hypothetical protein JD844_001870 [Phrynosoma platyrhinos]
MDRWGFLCFAVAFCLSTARAAKLGIVNTEGGFVEGVNKKLGLFGDYVDIFKGIPFAAPTKTLEDPQPHPGWPVSTNLPVMIWIYGGAFLWGGGQGPNFFQNYLYDGEEIATRGKVIVVTFNYRVGPLGFLSTGDASLPGKKVPIEGLPSFDQHQKLHAEEKALGLAGLKSISFFSHPIPSQGNYGLKDQHMAIAWVKRNIKNFGGDPDNITIFGESAGAVSVSLQILSPYNKGLIKRAISQSGLCDGLLFSSADPLVHYLAFSPVVDGDFLPDVPQNLFANAADIDYIAGVNNMDAHFFASIDMPALNRPLVKITAEEVYNIVRGLTLEKGVEGAKQAFSLYTQMWTDNVNQEVMKRTVIDLETDYVFLIPTQQTLALHSLNAKSGKTYSYVFSQPSRLLAYPSWVGADHADDLQYIFGKPFATPLGYRPQDRTVSKAMIAYWTNFARTGDPNKGESSVPIGWIAYDTQQGYYLEINNDINYDSVKHGLRNQFVQFWSTSYRKLPDVAVTMDLK